MTQTIYLVDSKQYVESNCFQHQLLEAVLHSAQEASIDIKIVELAEALSSNYDNVNVVSVLKQRTIDKQRFALAKAFKNASFIVYDQDPWQAYMDDSPYKGSYDRIAETLNVSSFAITSPYWVDLVKSHGHNAIFAKMSILPRYCGTNKAFLNRNINVGFVGTMHPRRQQLVSDLKKLGVTVEAKNVSNLSYERFLQSLEDIQIFIHNEEMPIYINGRVDNFKHGMWVKDIEAAAKGCYSIRCNGIGANHYFNSIDTIKVYETLEEVPDLVSKIMLMNSSDRQKQLDAAILTIKNENAWLKTAKTILGV